MLVLNRNVGERIVIDGGIELVVISIDRGKVRLGISAPPETHIWRAELVPPAAEDLHRDGIKVRIAGGLL